MTTDTKMFIDIDGVINAYDGKSSIPSWGWPSESGRVVDVLGFPIVYSPEMIARLRAVANRPHVQAYWLTTWEAQDAWMDLAEAVCIGSDWPVVYRGQYSETPWWKLDAMQKVNNDFNGKIVWVDDDLNFCPEAVEWVTETPNVIGICPRTTTGITMRHMKLIEVFVGE